MSTASSVSHGSRRKKIGSHPLGVLCLLLATWFWPFGLSSQPAVLGTDGAWTSVTWIDSDGSRVCMMQSQSPQDPSTNPAFLSVTRSIPDEPDGYLTFQLPAMPLASGDRVLLEIDGDPVPLRILLDMAASLVEREVSDLQTLVHGRQALVRVVRGDGSETLHPFSLEGVGQAFELLFRDCATAAPVPRRQVLRIQALNHQVMDLVTQGDMARAGPLAERVFLQAEQLLGGDHPETEMALGNLTLVLQDQGRDTEAEPLLRRLIKLRAQSLGPGDPLTAMTVQSLARVVENLGHADEAERLFRRVLAMREKALGPEDPETLMSLDTLAWFYLRSERPVQAERLWRRALEVRERDPGGEHPVTADTMQRLGVSLTEQRRYVEAEKFLGRALAIHERTLEPHALEITLDLGGLANNLEGQGRYGEAEPLRRRLIGKREDAMGPEAPLTAVNLWYLAKNLEHQGRYQDAEPLLRSLIEIRRRTAGADDPATLDALDGLAWNLRNRGKYQDAESIYRQAIAMRERRFGPRHLETAQARARLGQLHRLTGRYGEAEVLMLQVFEDIEHSLGPYHPETAWALTGLAIVYQELGRYDVAEDLLMRALEINDHPANADDADRVTAFNNLAMLYQQQGRFPESELLLRRAIESSEAEYGRDDALVVMALQNLATLYTQQGRYAEAEPLFLRVLDIQQRTRGREWPEAAKLLGNLANLLLLTGRYQEAEPLVADALAIAERVFGADHPETALHLNTGAQLAQALGQERLAAERLRRAVEIFESSLGPDHPNTLRARSNLGALLLMKQRYAEAEPILQSALERIERSLGGEHPDTAMALLAMAVLYHEQGRPREALPYVRRAAEVFRPGRSGQRERPDVLTASLGPQAVFTTYLMVLARLAEQPEADSADLAAEAFRVGQGMRLTAASRALQRMAARFAAGEDELSRMVRDHQDAQAQWSATDAALVEALSRAAVQRNVAVEADLRARLERIEHRRAELEAELAKRYPAYAELANPQPLESEQAQRLLGPGEALVTYIFGPVRSYAWVVGNERIAMRELDVSVTELSDAVTALRTGLDPGSQAARGARKPGRKGMVVGGFDLARAHDLYLKIWKPIEHDLEGAKQVLLVPDGPLAALPFSVLVRTAPAEQTEVLEGLRRADWLVKTYATTTLPAVSSLRALRELAAAGPVGQGFAGFGDPLLGGDQRPQLALARQDVRGVVSNMESLRQLAPLPDSAGELRALAASLKGRETLLLLGPEATEKRVRALDLSRFGILAFATHGLMAGELDGLSEPGLVLTPPATATAEDDGVLSAGEIAGLRLNAEWIILSACNTAAPDGSPGGEGLSGLAQAFFYGGARSLLVSHWSVYSQAAVDITTGILREIERRPGIGRARALRRTMLQLIEQGANPHPSYWAPFVVVGEGGVRQANQ